MLLARRCRDGDVKIDAPVTGVGGGGVAARYRHQRTVPNGRQLNSGNTALHERISNVRGACVRKFLVGVDGAPAVGVAIDRQGVV